MNRGAALLFVFFSLLFFILVGRFLYIQITGQVDGQVLAVKAQEKTLKEKAVEASRGSIVDRKNEVIAEDTTSYTLVAILAESMTTNENDPQHVVDAEETAKQLAKFIDMDEEKILERLLKKKSVSGRVWGSRKRYYEYNQKGNRGIGVTRYYVYERNEALLSKWCICLACHWVCG